ncbi:MAG: aspartate-semialdehyde dehydrogenase [candidate division WOR-3 bacterium]
MKIAIIGATGLVGKRIIEVLEQREFPVSELKLFASEKSVGGKLIFKNQEFEVRPLSEADFSSLDLAFFAVDEKIAKEFVPKAKKHCLVIDKSSAFRLEEDVPLVVPEVNPEACLHHKNIIASPNCSTIQLVVVLAPLQKLGKINHIIITSLQSVSGAGSEAFNQLQYEIEKIAVGDTSLNDNTPLLHPIGANLIPQIGEIGKDGYTAEEKKIIFETKKILNQPNLSITATCVRVPVFIGHSQAVDITFDHKISVEEAITILKKAPGIKVYSGKEYPMPIDVVGRDDVLVGRIRRHLENENSLSLWIVADNLRKGAATNAVQIAELVLKR